MNNTDYEECRYAVFPAPLVTPSTRQAHVAHSDVCTDSLFPVSLVCQSTPQAHVAHSAMCSRTVWQFTKCHTISEHLVQSWFCTVWCFLVQTADGTTEDSDANASIDCCQLLHECFMHLLLLFPNILACHVSKCLLVSAKFYFIHTVNVLTLHIFKKSTKCNN
jgi:hypothetical protein